MWRCRHATEAIPAPFTLRHRSRRAGGARADTDRWLPVTAKTTTAYTTDGSRARDTYCDDRQEQENGTETRQ